VDKHVLPMPNNLIQKSFCTTREAANLLGVSVGTVQLWVESGLLKAWKTTGGHRRVLRDSVAELLHKKSAPALPMEDSVTAQIAPPPVQLRRLRVLVVEDDPLLLRLYEANISQWPMAPELRLTSNAVKALLMIGHHTPDLLITDLHMPGMDGFNMLRVLRSTQDLDNTTIVVVSGLDAIEITARGGIPQDIEILPKPIPFKRLLEIGQSIVKEKTLERRGHR
jgi:excisionase family DNA binding protein